MKINEYKLALVFTAAFVFSVHGSGAAIPFTQGFDTFNVDAEIASDPWAAPGLPALVKASPKSPDGSARLLYSPDEIVLNLDTTVPTLNSNIWWSAYARALPHSSAPDIGNAVAAFYLDSDGKLFASNDNSWLEIGSGFANNQWHRFSLHFDFPNELYNVYVGKYPHTHGSTLSRINTNPLQFNYTTNELTQVEVSGETYLDNIVLARGSAALAAGEPSPEESAVTTEAPRLVRENTLFTGPDLTQFGEGTLNGEFGKALASWLIDGDLVSIYDQTQGWVTFTYQGDYVWDLTTGTGSVDDFTIGPMTGLRIQKTGVGDRQEPAHVYTVGETATQASTTVAGEGKWNLLSLPFQAGSRTPSQLGLPTPGNGDMLAINDGGETYRILRYNNGWQPSWNQGSIAPGTGFWYFRYATGDTWTINF